MDGMFLGYKSLISLDLSSHETKFVSNMSSLFYDCWRWNNITFNNILTSIDLSNLDTSNVEDMN